jgi:hypothetical protein
MREVDPSNESNRPQISSVTSDFKERETRIRQLAPFVWHRLPSWYLDVVVSASLPSGPSGVPLVHLCAAGEGYLRMVPGARKRFVTENRASLVLFS